MAEEIKKISFLSKIFNIEGTEWPRVSVAWIIRFFYRTGFVMGWTVVVGMFVAKYGIFSLPYLFVIHAVFTIIGSVFYSTFLGRFSKEKLMILTIFAAGLIMFISVYFAKKNEVLFFSLLLANVSIFLVQFKMLMDGFTEELFTPLESERVFPIIEAAETLGGLLAGIVVLSLSNVIQTFQFVYLWIALIFLIVPFIVFQSFFTKDVPIFKSKKSLEKSSEGIFIKFKKQFADIDHLSFIKGLFLIVFFQWFLGNLMEFQYTKAVYQNVSHVVLEGGSGFEHSFVHSLGMLSILFSVSALIFQLFIGSRFIKSLGIIGSMILHPLVTLLSLLGLTSSFNIYTAVLAKNNFTVTNGLYTNAYHSSYYAVNEHLREYTRELLEGVIRPLGALVGTLILISVQLMAKEMQIILYVNLLMIVISLVILWVTFLQQKKYTQVALNDLLKSANQKAKFNAIDILAQKGHKSSLPILVKILLNEKENLALRIKILKAFRELKENSVLLDIIKCLDSPEAKIRGEAINVLLSYKVWNDSSKKNLFIKYDLLSVLKNIYKTETDEKLRIKIISLMSALSLVSSVDFLLDAMKKASVNLKANIISSLGDYGDSSILKFLTNYLNSRNPKLQISAAIAFGKFPEYQNKANYIISSFLYSKSLIKIAYGLYAIGELAMEDKKDFCLKHLKSKNIELKLNSAIALAKINDNRSIEVLVRLLFSKDLNLVERVKDVLINIDERIKEKIDKLVLKIVSQKINAIMHKHKHEVLEQLSQKELRQLNNLYALIGII